MSAFTDPHNSILGSPMRRVRSQNTVLGLGAQRTPVAVGKRPLTPDSPDNYGALASSLAPCTPRKTALGLPLRMAPVSNGNRENINVDSNRLCATIPARTVSVPEEVAASKQRWTLEDFTVGKAIGKGKFGNVYVAQVKDRDACPSLPVCTALKVVHKSQLLQNGDQKAAQLLMQEVDILSSLSHRHIVRLFG